MSAELTEGHFVPNSAIVIDRARVPRVVATDEFVETEGQSWPKYLAYKDRGTILADALEGLAIVEWIDANPEIDESDVKTVEKIIGNLRIGTNYRDIARAIVASGLVEVKK